ncbi:unnamed protein product, partial [marine sediment metagenome]
MNKKMNLAKRIIVALDVGLREEALPLIRQLEGIEIFKVGLRLFMAEGPSLFREVKFLQNNFP